MMPAWTCVAAGGEAAALAELGVRLGLPGPVRLTGRDAHGRPRAEAADRAVPVSLSRCRDRAAVALGLTGRVGIDLVDPARAPLDLTDLATPEERAWLTGLAGPARRARLLQLWACREALLKALGLGLALDLGAVVLAPAGDGLRPVRVLGCPEPPVGWHVATAAAEGLVVGVAWAD